MLEAVYEFGFGDGKKEDKKLRAVLSESAAKILKKSWKKSALKVCPLCIVRCALCPAPFALCPMRPPTSRSDVSCGVRICVGREAYASGSHVPSLQQ